MQVLVDLDGGGVITIFPERALVTFALVILLRGAPCDELHTVSNYVSARIFKQKMNVVGRHHIIEHAPTEPLLCLENPMQVAASVARSDNSRS
jgi:hypothetical protein